MWYISHCINHGFAKFNFCMSVYLPTKMSYIFKMINVPLLMCNLLLPICFGLSTLIRIYNFIFNMSALLISSISLFLLMIFFLDILLLLLSHLVRLIIFFGQSWLSISFDAICNVLCSFYLKQFLFLRKISFLVQERFFIFFHSIDAVDKIFVSPVLFLVFGFHTSR